MKFQTKQPLAVEIDGQPFSVQIPNVGHIEEMMADTKKMDEAERLSYLRVWLGKLGLPLDVSGKLYVEQLTELMEQLTGAKKK